VWAERPLAQDERAAEHALGGVHAAGRRVGGPQVVDDAGHLRVMRSLRLLGDAERPAMEPARLRVLALPAVELSQVGERGGETDVVGAEARLGLLARREPHLLGLGELPLAVRLGAGRHVLLPERVLGEPQRGREGQAEERDGEPRHWYARRRPGRGHSAASSRPVPEAVMYAVRRSRPPKQMLVVSGSPVGTCSSTSPPGEITVMAPVTSVATQTLPAPSTASESKSWKPGSPARSVPPPGRSEEHTSELQSRSDLVCRRLLSFPTRRSADLSRPPKQMLVVSGSPVGTCSSTSPPGEITVMAPVTSVATQTLPAPSTASESKSWKPGSPARSVPPPGP